MKERIFQLLKPEGIAIVNADDPATRFVLDTIDNPTLTFAMHAPAEITASVLERSVSEQTFLLCAGPDAIPVRTRIVGNSYIYHCMAAATFGIALGIDLPTIVRGLESLDGLPGRWERIECGQSFATIVDQAHTADALAVTLKALRQVTSKRLICVYGGRGGGLKDERPLMGRTVERYADVGVITNTNPGLEEPFQIVHDILDGYDRPAQAQVMPDRMRAIGWALAEARAGDTVLIAGRGNETLHAVADRVDQFDDREVVRGFLYEMGAAPPSYARSILGT
jgi:UDP-N-acetylmuramoyl-L-alanyl-D-glutamate--2,6-diaminopimelate ligase